LHHDSGKSGAAKVEILNEEYTKSVARDNVNPTLRHVTWHLTCKTKRSK
jgi:hypothetical protein